MTEMGVIPEDWEVKNWGNLFDFGGGYSASRDQLSSKGYCYLHYGDIHTSSKTIVDVRADYQNIPKLDVPIKRISAKSLLEDGDVVFVDASEDDAGTSKHIVVVNKEGTPFISGLHTIVAKSKTDELEHAYRRFCFQTVSVKRQFFFYAVGTKVSGISKTNIAKLLLVVPSKLEQRAIAEALSDVDELLSGLERLIAKKRDIKQATMQELLTGKTRLPGFSGEWEVKCFGELTVPRTERVDPRRSGVHEFCVELEYIESGTGQLLGSASTNENSSLKSVFREGDILFGKLRAYLRKYWLATKSGVCSTEIWVFAPNARLVTSAYLYHVVKADPFIDAASTAYGTHMPRSDWNVVKHYELHLPSVLEQTAIAEVLSDMDAELAALEQRLEKTRALKQAMMQELLTGNTRLV